MTKRMMTNERGRWAVKRWILLALPALLFGCGGDPSGPANTEVAGNYLMTELRFDPRGSLPEVDLLPALGAGDAPRLTLVADGRAQLILQDPASGLLATANGSYSTPGNAVRLAFETGGAFEAVLLSRRMTFELADAGRLEFRAEAPDGVARQRLIELVPDWADEQLLDPVPGSLKVVFTRLEQ